MPSGIQVWVLGRAALITFLIAASTSSSYAKCKQLEHGYNALKASRDWVYSTTLSRLESDHLMCRYIYFIRFRSYDMNGNPSDLEGSPTHIRFRPDSSNYALWDSSPGQVEYDIQVSTSRGQAVYRHVFCNWKTRLFPSKHVTIYNCESFEQEEVDFSYEGVGPDLYTSEMIFWKQEDQAHLDIRDDYGLPPYVDQHD